MISEAVGEDVIALALGCTFELETSIPIAAVMQVAPGLDPAVRMQREVWETAGCEHRGYVDLYGNRCRRLVIAAGTSRIAYEAQLLLSHPADVIDLEARETPVERLPDETIAFTMPSRFGLPDELGHDVDFAAWFERASAGAGTRSARDNVPRTGRVVVGRGRDAVDVALITSFGRLTLAGFEVRAERSETNTSAYPR